MLALEYHLKRVNPKSPYIMSIRTMKMSFFDLLKDDKKARELRLERLSKDWEDIKEVIYYSGFPYIPKIICFRLINRHHDNPLAGHFRIEKT